MDIQISVVIPTRNRAAHLKRVVDNLLQDEYPHKEIIVCDGASTDETVDLLKSYGNRVRWISEPDEGEYEARNKGLRMARGDVIKYMSDDDVLLPGSFAYAAKYLRDNPETDILFGQSIAYDERGGREPVLYDTRLRKEKSVKLRNFIRGHAPQPTSETVFFRRSVIDRIGLFNTDLQGADYDFWARAAKANVNIQICDRVFVHYHISDLSAVARKSTQLLFERLHLAQQYGDLSDRLYVLFYLIPSRLITLWLVKYLPAIGIPLRHAWVKFKTRRPLKQSDN